MAALHGCIVFGYSCNPGLPQDQDIASAVFLIDDLCIAKGCVQVCIDWTHAWYLLGERVRGKRTFPRLGVLSTPCVVSDCIPAVAQLDLHHKRGGDLWTKMIADDR